MTEIQFIRRTTQQKNCDACHGEGKIYDHMCYICQGTGKVPFVCETDVTDNLQQMKRYIDREEFKELFTNKP
jgi:DnaJ-class molecular chaperone